MENYVKAQLLGKGSFGAAFLATSKRDGKKYVLKEIDISRMQKKEREAAEQEAKVPLHVHVQCKLHGRGALSMLPMLLQVLQALHHPNVVSCKEAFTSLGKLIIVMDYCSEGVHLLSCIRNAGRLACAFASGIRCLLHEHRLIKRKPSCRADTMALGMQATFVQLSRSVRGRCCRSLSCWTGLCSCCWGSSMCTTAISCTGEALHPSAGCWLG